MRRLKISASSRKDVATRSRTKRRKVQGKVPVRVLPWRRGVKPKLRSHFEDGIAASLRASGVVYEYEPETFDYRGRVSNAQCSDCGSRKCFVRRKYTPDFKIADFYVEAKGKFTATIRARMEDFLKSHPEINLRFVFQRDNWTTSTRRERYSGWAERHGCKWAIDSIPDSWLKDEE